MKRDNLMLIIASLLSILFMTLHLTGDTIRARAGSPEAGGSTLVAVPVLVVLLYGTLLLADRRSGHIIMLVGSVLALGVPVIHVMGPGGIFTGQIARSGPAFLFVWTSRHGRDGDVLSNPLGAGTVEAATGPARIVLRERVIPYDEVN